MLNKVLVVDFGMGLEYFCLLKMILIYHFGLSFLDLSYFEIIHLTNINMVYSHFIRISVLID